MEPSPAPPVHAAADHDERPATERRLTMALVADTDSRWKWAKATARKIGEADLHHLLIDGPGRPNERQLREAGIEPSTVTATTISGLAEALAATGAEVAIVALPGGACQAVLHALAAHPTTDRPVVITGYVGVVYEKIVEGLLLRAGSDIIIANSPHDARQFRSLLSDYGADPAAVVESPLPYLVSTPRPARTAEHPYTVTFAAQPSVPATRRERAYVVQRLVQHARLHPERAVILKLRSLPGERVTHPDPFPYPSLLKQVGELPGNFSLVGGPMAEVLARTDLLLTVSSTAAVEAIHAGIPTGILTDFGIGDHLGTPFYAGSGCLTCFTAIDEGVAPSASTAWAQDNGVGAPDHQELRSRVLTALAARPLPPITPFYSVATAGAYLPRLLAAYGLGPDGEAVLSSARSRRLVPRLARACAHRLYRVGESTVAPLLRRLGSL